MHTIRILPHLRNGNSRQLLTWRLYNVVGDDHNAPLEVPIKMMEMKIIYGTSQCLYMFHISPTLYKIINCSAFFVSYVLHLHTGIPHITMLQMTKFSQQFMPCRIDCMTLSSLFLLVVRRLLAHATKRSVQVAHAI